MTKKVKDTTPDPQQEGEETMADDNPGKTSVKKSARSRKRSTTDEVAAEKADAQSSQHEGEQEEEEEVKSSAANDDDEGESQEEIARRLAVEQQSNTMARKPLALKMARVMAEVRHVPKNGRNDFHKYDYIMESDLVDRLRGKLAEQGVALLPSIREHVSSQINDHRGKPQNLATITLDITFVDGDSGDSFTTSWVGQGVDSGDKAYYKAYTGAFKYALLKTFLVTAEDDSPRSVRAPSSNYGRSRRRA